MWGMLPFGTMRRTARVFIEHLRYVTHDGWRSDVGARWAYFSTVKPYSNRTTTVNTNAPCGAGAGDKQGIEARK